jgi:hypothetical protein
MPTPVVLPGEMPFRVGFLHEDTHEEYSFVPTIAPNFAEGTTRLLASGLWKRLKPRAVIHTGVSGILTPDARMVRGWAIIDEACNPSKSTGILRDTVEHWVRYSPYPEEITGFASLRNYLGGVIAPNDETVISEVFRRWAWDRFGKVWGFSKRQYYRYAPLDYGEPFREEHYPPLDGDTLHF